jgi:predicted RNase H-like nuclease (RuvC/YqgF family)
MQTDAICTVERQRNELEDLRTQVARMTREHGFAIAKLNQEVKRLQHQVSAHGARVHDAEPRQMDRARVPLLGQLVEERHMKSDLLAKLAETTSDGTPGSSQQVSAEAGVRLGAEGGRGRGADGGTAKKAIYESSRWAPWM